MRSQSPMPGFWQASNAWHWLTGTYERYVILSGQGLVEVGDAAAAAVVG